MTLLCPTPDDLIMLEHFTLFNAMETNYFTLSNAKLFYSILHQTILLRLTLGYIILSVTSEYFTLFYSTKIELNPWNV